MKKIKSFVKEFGISILSLGLPVLASAQGIQQPPIQAPENIRDVNYILGGTGILCTTINWIFWLLIVLTIIFVLVAAFKYLTAAGDPEKVKGAGNTLLYAAVAVVVALIAKGLPLIVSSFIGGGLTSTGC